MALPQKKKFPPISAMALPQLVSVSRNFNNVITEIQNFLSPAFSLSLILLLNFGNTVAEIHSLFSIP